MEVRNMKRKIEHSDSEIIDYIKKED